MVRGDGQTGADLIDAGVDKVSFTGSAATGRKVAAACGERLIPVTLELGGKDAMIVCDDADLDRAASGAVIGSCMNTGHYCCGTERIYVVGGHYDSINSNGRDAENLAPGANDDGSGTAFTVTRSPCS